MLYPLHNPIVAQVLQGEPQRQGTELLYGLTRHQPSCQGLKRKTNNKQTTINLSSIIPFLPAYGMCHSLNRELFANYNLDA